MGTLVFLFATGLAVFFGFSASFGSSLPSFSRVYEIYVAGGSSETDQRREEIDGFFNGLVENIKYLKRIAESYDNETDAVETTLGFDKIEEFLLRLERRSYAGSDEVAALRRHVREMEKRQRRLFHRERQSVSVLRTFLPRLVEAMTDGPSTEGAVSVKENPLWLVEGDFRRFSEYSGHLASFLELVGNDFFEMRKLIDEIEGLIAEVESSVFKTHLLASDESKEKHVSLSLKRESKLGWLFQLVNNRNREVRALEMELLELNELEKYREFVGKFLGRKRRMLGDIDDFNDSVLKKTAVMSASLSEEKPSRTVLYRFAHELNALNALVKNRDSFELPKG